MIMVCCLVEKRNNGNMHYKAKATATQLGGGEFPSGLKVRSQQCARQKLKAWIFKWITTRHMGGGENLPVSDRIYLSDMTSGGCRF